MRFPLLFAVLLPACMPARPLATSFGELLPWRTFPCLLLLPFAVACAAFCAAPFVVLVRPFFFFCFFHFFPVFFSVFSVSFSSKKSGKNTVWVILRLRWPIACTSPWPRVIAVWAPTMWRRGAALVAFREVNCGFLVSALLGLAFVNLLLVGMAAEEEEVWSRSLRWLPRFRRSSGARGFGWLCRIWLFGFYEASISWRGDTAAFFMSHLLLVLDRSALRWKCVPGNCILDVFAQCMP